MNKIKIMFFCMFSLTWLVSVMVASDKSGASVLASLTGGCFFLNSCSEPFEWLRNPKIDLLNGSDGYIKNTKGTTLSDIKITDIAIKVGEKIAFIGKVKFSGDDNDIKILAGKQEEKNLFIDAVEKIVENNKQDDIFFNVHCISGTANGGTPIVLGFSLNKTDLAASFSPSVPPTTTENQEDTPKATYSYFSKDRIDWWVPRICGFIMVSSIITIFILQLQKHYRLQELADRYLYSK